MNPYLNKKAIVSKRGQWDYPGQDTIVPTPDGSITMQGVNYPVYGQDETGYGQMMYPNKEYQFPGNMVYETPMMGKGGEMIKRADGSYSQRGLWDNIRANKGSGKKPTEQMLEQEKKIKKQEMQSGGIVNPYLKKYGPGGETDPYDPTTSYIRPKKVNVDGKEMSTYSNEYRNLYNTGNIMPVYEGLPSMYGPEVEVTAEAPEWLKEKRRIEAQGRVAAAVRKGTGSFARPILETGLELSGVPGAVRFSKDPIKNLQGTANILSYTNIPGLIGHGIDYAMGNPFFNVTEEDWQGLANTVDVAGLATLGAGTALKLAPKAVTSIPRMLGKIPDVNPNIGLRFADEAIEANKALSTRQRQVVPQTTQSIPKEYTPWTMQEMPGLHIKSTMSGSPFEKQLSKAGELNVNNVQAHINRADVGQQDKYILQKVLNEKFAGKQKVDYNEFRKAVSDELVTLNRVPIEDYQHKLWGVQEIGYPGLQQKSYKSAIESIKHDEKYFQKLSPFIKSYEKIVENGVTKYKVPNRYTDGYVHVPEDKIAEYLKHETKLADEFYEKTYPKIAEYEEALKTMPQVDITTYENVGKFGKGNEKHFNKSTLAHTRTMVDPNQPGIWHTLEQQSDYYQDANRYIPKENTYTKWNEKLAKTEMTIQEDMDLLEYMKKNKKTKAGDRVDDFQIKQFEDRLIDKKRSHELQKGAMANPQQKEFLGSAHQERLLQENVRLAAERGMNQVRYPTPETAIKIQKYQKERNFNVPALENGDEIILADGTPAKVYDDMFDNSIGVIKNDGTKISIDMNAPRINQNAEIPIQSVNGNKVEISYDYTDKHKTIIRKYKENQKTIEKTLGVKVRTVTDPKGNTWYEFDIPDAYKKGKAEIKAFSYGGQNPYIKYANGGTVDPVDPEDKEAAMRGMMKARMAIDSTLGRNPAAIRMTSVSPKEYTFTGNEMFYDEKVNVPAGSTGTHYTTGEGNVMFPIIQEGQDGNLFFNRYASPTDREAMRFETPEEASYFSENYKNIAPMMYNQQMSKGGESDLVPVEVERSERIYDKKGNLLKEIPADAPTHEEGGVKLYLRPGTLVFPKKYYKALDAASGLPEFNKIKEKMLDNAEKAYLRGEPYSSGGRRN